MLTYILKESKSSIVLGNELEIVCVFNRGIEIDLHCILFLITLLL